MILSINSFLIACQDNLDEAAPIHFQKTMRDCIWLFPMVGTLKNTFQLILHFKTVSYSAFKLTCNNYTCICTFLKQLDFMKKKIMWYTVHVHALDRRKFFHLSARSVSLWIYYQQQKLNLFLIRYPDYYMLYSIEQFCLVRLAFWKAITCTHKKTTRQMILEYCASF